jgi:UPF0176 protein
MQKIILYYKFAPIADPDAVRLWQRTLCEKLHLRGRIIVSGHGINGTLGGELDDLKTYVKETKQFAGFKDTAFKWSDGQREDFPKLSVKVRDELVTLAPGEAFDVFDSGTSLDPEAWHAYLETHPDAIILDARNNYESAVGAFEGAVAPDIKTFKDIKPELEKLPKDQPILTYCTGDVRCEYLSAYMKHKGFQDVYHLDGGIVKYGQKYGDKGKWQGKCYVFDKRMKIAFSDDAKDVGRCAHCGAETSEQVNCADLGCNLQFVVCANCAGQKTMCERHV